MYIGYMYMYIYNNRNKSMFPEDLYSKINHQKAWFKLHYYSITCRPTYIIFSTIDEI